MNRVILNVFLTPLSLFSLLFGITVSKTCSAEILYHLTDLGTLGGGDSRAIGLNSAGSVVGWAYTPDEEIRHAYRYSQGLMHDIHLSGDLSEARAINDSGQIVGFVADRRSARATLWQNGVEINLDPFGTDSLANDINKLGQITGEANFSRGENSHRHAFCYKDGVLQDIGTLGGSLSSGLAINSSGDIVGFSLTPKTEWQQRAFVYSATDGTMRDLGTLGGEHSQANGINDSGKIVGWAWRKNGHSEAFVYENNHIIGLGTLNGVSSSALDVNENGEIVGWWSRDGFSRSAFTTQGGQMVDLNSLIDPATNWRLVEARAINDCGQIVGFGIDPNGVDRGFLLTPVPAPSTLFLFISLSLFVSLQRR